MLLDFKTEVGNDMVVKKQEIKVSETPLVEP